MGVAVGGAGGAEPAFAGSGEHALFGVAELTADLVHAQVGFQQYPLGGVATGLISAKVVSLGGEPAAQRFGMQAELAGGEFAGGQQLADDAAQGVGQAARVPAHGGGTGSSGRVGGRGDRG